MPDLTADAVSPNLVNIQPGVEELAENQASHVYGICLTPAQHKTLEGSAWEYRLSVRHYIQNQISLLCNAIEGAKLDAAAEAEEGVDEATQAG